MTTGFGSLPTSPLPPVPPPIGAIDAGLVQQQWLNQFVELDDPRGRQGIEHAFLSIVMIAILATISGAQGWKDIKLSAESHGP